MAGLQKAIFYNGFSDHFLTDGFAAGHVRNPRAQIQKWAAAHGLSFLSAGVFASVIHDNDGSLRTTGGRGLQVKNSRGDSWAARSDTELFRFNSLENPSVRLPTEAVVASLREVLETYRSGIVPTGFFSATLLVPFVNPKERPLVEIFAPTTDDRELDQIIQRVAWFLKVKIVTGFDKNVLLRFYAGMPDIVAQFGKDAAAAIAINPQLSVRLPRAYLDGYINIH